MPLPTPHDHTNRWFRIPGDDRYHLNIDAPDAPATAKSDCGITTTEPQYASAVHGLGTNPSSVADKCLYCHSPESRSRSATP